MTTKPDGLNSPEAIRMGLKAFPESRLPQSPAGRLASVMDWLHGRPIFDEEGEPTGEYTEPLIDAETARRLLAEVDKP